MAFWSWSKTAASNATADSTINWAEGQAPGSVNDSSRAMMARTAEYRDDICGAIATSGTSTAYIVSSNQVFDTLAHMNGALIAFTPHTANGATVTLNVDGLGAKPLRISPNVELQSNSLITGTPYAALYNNSDAAWYLFGSAASNIYNTPLGGGLIYFASPAPNSAFAIPIGQALSRTTYATLFSLIGTTYGAGDASTTFNIPDLRGRIPAGLDGGTSRLTTASGMSGTGLGATGGGETVTLTANQIPSITSANAAQNILVSANNFVFSSTGTGTIDFNPSAGSGFRAADNNATFTHATSSASNSISVTSSNTGGLLHTNVQPTIAVNYIMRVI